MAFPSSPANGQRASVNNIIYEYNDTKGAWLRVSAQGFTSANLTVGGIITDNYYRADGTSLLGVNKSVYNGTASATTSVSLVDSVPTAGNTSVSWSLTSKDSNNSTYKNSVVSSLNDGTNVYYSEYGIILSNASVSVSTFTSNIVSGNLRLYAVGDSANVTITFQRTLLGSSTDVGYLTAGGPGAQGPEGNVNVSYGNTEVATYLTTYTGNLSAGATTIDGNLTVSGNLIVNGNVTYINANNVNINDSLIYLADDNPADTLDIGFVSAFTDATRYQHTGIVRDATDGVWKLFANVVAEPNTTVDFTNANYSNLQIGNLIANNITATTNDLTLSAISIGNVNLSTLGGLQFKAIEATGSVNVWNVRGGDGSTTSPRFTTEGTGTNIAGQFNTKGTGALQFYSGNTEQMRITNTASAVNYVQVTGSATTKEPIISVAGSDADISMAFQPKGTGAIDLAAGSSGVNISNGGTVTAITRSAAGSGYTTPPTVAISAPSTAGGVQATATVTIGLVSVTSVANGGTGYTVGNVLTLVGGTSTVACQVTVTAVSSGVITAASVTTGGSYTVAPTNPVSVTGGSGSGATFNLSFCIGASFTITAAGSGYVEQPTVTFSGGGGSGAAAYARVGSGTVFRTLGSNVGFYTPGGPAFEVGDLGATTVDYVSALGGTGGAYLGVAGSSANPNLYLSTKGTGAIQFFTNGQGATRQFNIAHTASAVNYVQVTGSATGGLPAISAQGSDSDVTLRYNSKGLGGHIFYNGGGVAQFRIGSVTSAANFLRVNAAIATASPALVTEGTDTNIDLTLTSKGSGNITTANSVVISNSSASTSTTTGALVVTGGVGIGGNLFVDGTTNTFAGNVGIGNTAPINKLTVSGGIELTGSAFSGSGVGLWQQTTNVLGFVTAGSTRAVIDATGNVGIGTVTPLHKLSVNGNVFASGNLTITSSSASTSTTTGALVVTGGVGIDGNLFVGGAVNNPTVTNYTESVVAIGTVTTASTLSLTNGTVQTATLTASTACTFTMPTATAGKSFVLLLKQAAATGNGTATFTGVKFNGVGAPTITAAAGKMDILSFISDGTNWYGSYTQGYTP